MAQRSTEADHPGAATKRPGYLPAVLLFLAGALVFAWPWLSGAVTIPWDAKAHFYPQLVFLARALHEGQSPFWAPQVFGGHPQIADPQSLIFSPLYLALAALREKPGFVAFDALVFAHLAMGGLALMMLFRDRKWRAEGALVAALAFAFGCSAAWRVQHVGQIMSLSWFVVALWLALRMIDRRSLLDGAAAGLAAGLMAIGRDQIAWLGVWLLLLIGLWRVGEGGWAWSRLRGLLAPVVAGTVVGLIVIAAPIAFTLALAAQSNRAEIDFAGAIGGSLHPAALYTFVSANLFGTDGPLADYWGPPSSQVWGETGLALARNMADVYFGALPFVAVLVFGLLRGGVFAREVRVFTLAAALLLLFALGGYTPFFTLAYHLPGADLFRRPADATFPLGAMLAILAGYVVHRRLEGAWPARRERVASETALVSVALALCVLVAIEKDRLDQALPILSASALWLMGGYALLRLLPRLSRRPLVGLVVLAAFVVADLRVNNGPNESTALPPAVYDALRPDTTDETMLLMRKLARQDQAPDRRDRVEMAAIDYHYPNAGLSHDVDHWLGFNPLRLKWFAEATGAIDQVAIPDQRRFAPLFARYASPLADLLGVRYVATGVPAQTIDKAFAPGDLVPVARTPNAWIYENPGALPRVLFATKTQGADFAAMTKSGDWPAVDYRETVLLENPPPAAAVVRAPGRVALVDYRNTEVTIDAESPQGGWVVLLDVWHPWWRAQVDGAPAEIRRADVLFRAVEVGPGKHRVRFTFAPFSGLWADLTGRR